MALDPKIIDKLMRYCSYRERAISELRMKLKALGVRSNQHDEYLNELEEEGYLNEERFVSSFVEGKLRIKGWGKNKIRMHLTSKQVDQHLINKALDELEEEEYLEKLQDLAKQKLELVKGQNDYEKKAKVFRYLQQKGFETSLIHTVLFQ